MKRIFACLPCYNEEENIAALIEKWQNEKAALQEMGYQLLIIAIDDKSTDRTAEIIGDFVAQSKNVKAVYHKVNKNLGGGVATAFKVFRKCGKSGDLCVLMDGDNTHDPKYVISMVQKIEAGADCVIASRYCGNAEIVGVPKNRVFLSDAAKYYYQLVLNVKNVKDYTCGYRVYRYDIITKAHQIYGSQFIQQKNFSCMMEVLYKLSLVGAKFDEVPFVLRYDNKQGQSKMNVLKTMKSSIITALRLRLTSKR